MDVIFEDWAEYQAGFIRKDKEAVAPQQEMARGHSQVQRIFTKEYLDQFYADLNRNNRIYHDNDQLLFNAIEHGGNGGENILSKYNLEILPRGFNSQPMEDREEE